MNHFPSMKTPSSSPPRHPGFTLVEILVVIAIIVILAAVGFQGASKGFESARISQNTQKLRGLSALLATYATEYGHYPPGDDDTYDQGPPDKTGHPMGGRCVDIVNAWEERWEINDGWLSPSAQSTLEGYRNKTKQPTNYTGHPRIMYTGGDEGPPIDPITIQRPGEVFLLCDGVPEKPADLQKKRSVKNAAISMKRWYTHYDNPAADAERAIGSKTKRKSGSNAPDFRNRGKCHVAFVDGHVESFEPKDFKVKHVSLAF